MAHANCPVEVVVGAEFGISVPHDRTLVARLAVAYCLRAEDCMRLAPDAAERRHATG